MTGRPWRRELTPYRWWVLIAASLGWMFDTMDQRIFVLARGPAIASLLPSGAASAGVTWYSGLANAVFLLGWAIGLSALAQNPWDFMAYRFLTGLGVGGEFAAGVTLVAAVMPDAARPHALGILQTLSALGNITGSAISFVVLPLGWPGCSS